MPEGPSIVILKELVEPFKGQKVLLVSGNSKVDIQRAQGKIIKDFKSWGKHFLICFDDFTIKIHFMLFGSYRINEEKDATPRLSLQFTKAKAGPAKETKAKTNKPKTEVLNFYACSVKILEDDLDELYDWSTDVMSDEWDPKGARKKLKANPEMLACDALLDQTIFAGSGNIIKNEVLFRTKIHPLSHVGALPPKKLTELITETRTYSFDFLKWKKAFIFKKQWLAHTKRTCPRCNLPYTKAHLGQHHRRSFFCENCQVLYK